MKTACFDRNSNSMEARRRNSEGSVSTIVLVVMLLIGMTLASYLNLVANQNISVQRSQAWNSVVPVAEAGIEEALAHLNRLLRQLHPRFPDAGLLQQPGLDAEHDEHRHAGRPLREEERGP